MRVQVGSQTMSHCPVENSSQNSAAHCTTNLPHHKQWSQKIVFVWFCRFSRWMSYRNHRFSKKYSCSHPGLFSPSFTLIHPHYLLSHSHDVWVRDLCCSCIWTFLNQFNICFLLCATQSVQSFLNMLLISAGPFLVFWYSLCFWYLLFRAIQSSDEFQFGVKLYFYSSQLCKLKSFSLPKKLENLF